MEEIEKTDQTNYTRIEEIIRNGPIPNLANKNSINPHFAQEGEQ